MRINLAVAGLVLMLSAAAPAQKSHWASADDATAKDMIEKERSWAEAECKKQEVGQDFLADDFQGTAPDGSRYGKAEAVKLGPSIWAKDCKLDEAKVRFFGDSVAMIYGAERSTRKDKEGKEFERCLVWTDTWMKRDGKWQIIAVQDAVMQCK